MSRLYIASTALATLLLFSGYNEASENPDTSKATKVELDLTQLDENGLRGPANGKVAVSYEFAIPNTPENRKEVRKIDSTIQFMDGSKGRIQAGDGETLCIGSTHQQNYRAVLLKLSALPYVARIIECHFE
ncbi:hypothetical protein [Rubritalea sp.]|uniref:hypothetical protein n=1 Tax=Rubritalea sp. TaxID=2109375 RepID=UPI003EF65CF8